MPGSRNYAIESFRKLVCTVFPTNDALPKVLLSGSLKDSWQKLQSLSGATAPVFARTLAEGAAIPLAETLKTTPEIISRLPADMMRKGLFLPLELEDGVLQVAAANPVDEDLTEEIRLYVKHPVRLLLATPEDIEEGLFIALAPPGETQQHSKGIINAENLDESEELAPTDDETISKLAKQLLAKSIEMRASDLHLQPFLGGGVARARVDGMLRRVALLQENVYNRLSRYCKVQGGMDPANTRTPQDGRVSFSYKDAKFDLRISALPAHGGERIVIRFLDQSRRFNLSHNGFSLAEIQALRRLIGNASGLVVVTGPTGSGKTSTLYALLGELNASHRNIITVENPVEYLLPGISQVEVNEKTGLSFSSVLRSTLRQDPDVILIGEIRDRETAEIAFQAALTGHLVLSTLHTNDAFSAIPRLLDLGIRPAVLADSLVGIVAQRLCRRLCVACRTASKEPLNTEEETFKAVTRIVPPYRPGGCEACGFTGYRGRVPITEIIEPSTCLRDAIFGKETTTECASPLSMLKLATLASSAARHVGSGNTTVKDAVRVLGRAFWSALCEEHDAEMPESVFLLEQPEESKAPGILLLGPETPQNEALSGELEHAWFAVFRAQSPEEAKAQLEEHDNIVQVVVDLDENLKDTEILDFVQQARTALYWSRLPALLLLPPGRDKLEERLVADGAKSPCLVRPLPPGEVLQRVRLALSGSRK